MGITPLNINLPMEYFIDGREYLLLFPRSYEEKLKRMDEIGSINIVIGYKEQLRSIRNEKVEVNLELELLAIEFEFCDGTRISGRSGYGELRRRRQNMEQYRDLVRPRRGNGKVEKLGQELNGKTHPEGVDRRKLVLIFIFSIIKEKLTKRDNNRNAHCLRAQKLP
jgi:hypothetical protein